MRTELNARPRPARVPVRLGPVPVVAPPPPTPAAGPPNRPGEPADRRRLGLSLAAATALISGVSVFVNGYGVRAVPDATAYTTAKNIVAAAVLLVIALANSAGSAGRADSAGSAGRTGRTGRADSAGRAGSAGTGPAADDGRAGTGRPGVGVTEHVRRRYFRSLPGRLGALLTIGVIGGSLPFVLFFEGLARASSTQAAFWHKTLVVWVALLAVPVLAERVRAVHVGAVALLMTGQVVLAGGLHPARLGLADALILAATLFWAVEVVLARRLLRGAFRPEVLGAARMAIGAVLLVGWVAVSGRWSALAGLGAQGWTWVLITGFLLAGYVTTWFAALALAPAVDVTAMLVPAALVTALLNAVAAGALPGVPVLGGGLLLVAGAAVVAAARPARTAASL